MDCEELIQCRHVTLLGFKFSFIFSVELQNNNNNLEVASTVDFNRMVHSILSFIYFSTNHFPIQLPSNVF